MTTTKRTPNDDLIRRLRFDGAGNHRMNPLMEEAAHEIEALSLAQNENLLMTSVYGKGEDVFLRGVSYPVRIFVYKAKEQDQ